MPLKDGSLENYQEAAIRHLVDAELLNASSRLDNAGHLIGFAAECAIKHRIGALSPQADSPDQHLPWLLPAARKRLGSRANFASMYGILKSDIFSDWAIDWRYSSSGRVTQAQLDDWIAVTKRLFAASRIKMVRL